MRKSSMDIWMNKIIIRRRKHRINESDEKLMSIRMYLCSYVCMYLSMYIWVDIRMSECENGCIVERYVSNHR